MLACTPVTAENNDTAGKATGEPLPDPVIVALAIRDVGTCELAIPAANYDAFALPALIERHGATVH
jgi:hypothetical protein